MSCGDDDHGEHVDHAGDDDDDNDDDDDVVVDSGGGGREEESDALVSDLRKSDTGWP